MRMATYIPAGPGIWSQHDRIQRMQARRRARTEIKNTLARIIEDEQ